MSGDGPEDQSASGPAESASNSCGCFHVGLPLLVTLAGAIIGERMGADHGWVWTVVGTLARAVAGARLSVVAVTVLAWIVLRIVAPMPAPPAP